MTWFWNGIEHVKRWVWWAITPLFLLIRWLLLKSRIIKHDFRQPFLLGHLRAGKTPQNLLDHLALQGFTKNSLAWIDQGEVFSARCLLSLYHQYHIRLFDDGEIRGHYEWTPEAHPFDHLMEQGFEERREEFLEILGDMVVPKINDEPASPR